MELPIIKSELKNGTNTNIMAELGILS